MHVPSSTDAPGSDPSAAPPTTPFWMDVSPPSPQRRTGVTPDKNSGWQMLGFFALITLIVGAAGWFGIAMWGPEKPTRSRSHFATEPPPPAALPSLPADDTSRNSVPALASASPAESAAVAAASSSSPAPKRGKRTQGKRH